MNVAAAARRDRTAQFVQQWTERGLRSGALTAAEWRDWEVGARRCYAAAGRRWPAAVVRVPSPVVGAFAAPIAQRVITDLRRGNILVDKPFDGAATFGGGYERVIAAAVASATGATLDESVAVDVAAAVGSAVGGASRDVLDVEDLDYRAAVMSLQMGTADREIVASLSRWRAAVADARVAVGMPIRSAVDDVIGRAVYESVRSHIRAGVAATSRSQATRPCLWPWLERRGGRWRSAEVAVVAFVRDEVELPLGVGIRELSVAVQSAESAGYWWPFADFVMVSDLPTEVHTEFGPTGVRLHCDRGPAVVWADGWAIHAVHGRRLVVAAGDSISRYG